MKGRYSRLSIITMAMLLLLMWFIIYLKSSEGAVVTFSDLLLVLLFAFGMRILLFNSTLGEYVLLFLIVLAVPGLITLTYSIGDTEYSGKTVAHIGSLSFDPLAFLLLLFYLVINRKRVKQLLYGSEKEKIEKKSKLEQFYYDKFNQCDIDELNGIFRMFNNYPIEAQDALQRIHHEKGLAFLK